MGASASIRDKSPLAAAWCGSALWREQLSGPFHLNIVKRDPGLAISSTKSGLY